MKLSPCAMPVRHIRVLLIGMPGAAGAALSGWLDELAQVEVAGPAPTTVAALVLAARFQPEVVPARFPRITRIDQLHRFPSPLVFLLTHDASAAMRRRCLAMGVDAVFDKTTELETVTAVLEQTRKSFAASPAHQVIPIEV